VADRERVRASEERAREELEALRVLAPRDGEYDELERERGLLANLSGVKRALDVGHDRVSEREGSALELVRTTLRELEPHGDRSAPLGRIRDTLASIAAELAFAATELAREQERLDFDPARLALVDERLDAYRDLARRFAVGPRDPRRLAERWEALESELAGTRDPEHRSAELDEEIGERLRSLEALATELSNTRRSSAERLEAAVASTLGELALGDARFTVSVEHVSRAGQDNDARGASAADLVEARFPSTDGVDRVSFLFASSPGVACRPLGEVASGGELARVCLALKRGLAEADDVPLLVFDEVDQNVGGRLGAALGRALEGIARARQVLAVTHLPSVAAHGEKHLLVEKGVDRARRVTTTVRPLAPDERVRELALMIRGEPLTETSLEQARELLAAAAGSGPRARARDSLEPARSRPVRRRGRSRAL
jgi:DNA repair protein RecN (Recombination protein N)